MARLVHFLAIQVGARIWIAEILLKLAPIITLVRPRMPIAVAVFGGARAVVAKLDVVCSSSPLRNRIALPIRRIRRHFSGAQLPEASLMVLNRKLLVSVVFMSWLVCGAGLYLSCNRRTISEDAERAVTAIWLGDARTVMEYAFPQEIKENKLSSESWSDLDRAVLRPRLRGYHRIGRVHSRVYQDGVEAVAWIDLVDEAGHKSQINISLWATPDGPKGVVSNVVLNAWSLDGYVRAGKPFSVNRMIQSHLDGLEADRTKLERFGIAKLYDIDMEHGTLSGHQLTEVASNWTRDLVKRKREVADPLEVAHHN